LLDTAVNVYHTSNPGVPHPVPVKVTPELVEFIAVPVVPEQFTLEVKEKAPEQLLLVGGELAGWAFTLFANKSKLIVNK